MNIRSTAQLIDSVNHGNKVKYVFFWGHQEKGSEVTKSCFSQWYDAGFEVDGQSFLTAEHYMMYQKARLFADGAACERVLAAGNPAKAKAVGREVVGFDQHRWEEARFEIVIDANMAKFSQNPELKAFLLGTEDRVLVEASPVDRIWGIGLAQDAAAAENPNSWKGLNLLGFALMEVRERLRRS